MHAYGRSVRRVLVVLAASDRSGCLDEADRIAREFDASLSVVQVVSDGFTARDAFKQSLALGTRVAGETRRQRAAFDATIRVGDAVTQICDQALEDDIDLVIVGTDERHGGDRWRRVCVAIARSSACSVLVVRSSPAKRGPPLVVCSDSHDGSVLPSACAFARRLGESFVAIHDADCTANAIAAHARSISASFVVIGGGAVGRKLSDASEAVVQEAQCNVLILREHPSASEPQLRKREMPVVPLTGALEAMASATAACPAGRRSDAIRAFAPTRRGLFEATSTLIGQIDDASPTVRYC